MRHSLLLGFFVLTSCSSSKDVGKADEYVVDCNTLDGGQAFASDENYVKFVEAESARRVIADSCKSPELVAPDPASRLDPRTPPAFSFRATHVGCALRPQSGPVYGCYSVKPQRPLWSRLVGLGSSLLEGTAEAHCGAFSGENYFFRFKSSDNNPVYTAVLSVTAFTPDAGIWQRALSGRSGQILSLTIQRGVFFRGDINEGPYVQPQPYSFTVAP